MVLLMYNRYYYNGVYGVAVDLQNEKSWPTCFNLEKVDNKDVSFILDDEIVASSRHVSRSRFI